MFKTGMLALMFVAGVSADANLDRLAAEVNAAKLTWKAEPTKRFANSEQAEKLCGTWLEGHPNYMRLPVKNPTVPASLPSSFDARTAFSNCSVIRVVRDQSSCGSCWAFGSTESFEDRRCIQTGADVEMSVEDTASCCSGAECGFSFGCNGGQPSAALQWMSRVGVVTGGDYSDMNKSTSGCRPYSLPPCAHHVAPSAKYPKCPESEYPTPKCVHSCAAGYKNSYSEDKVRGMSAHSVEGVENIMAELNKGPLAVAFTVYEDLLNYKSGVYVHHTGRALGGHAVEMIGYGVEDGVDYWIIKNSWNEMWGDNGYFKIKKGVNECGIEGDVSGVTFHN